MAMKKISRKRSKAAKAFRIEHDSMGDLDVPADALWGAQTQRAVHNFPISGRPMPSEFIRALHDSYPGISRPRRFCHSTAPCPLCSE